MSGYKAECRKFQANIFNKSKCTNCFKQREEHSTDALDSNRASRKVSKCGYLFVAPDWDFTIPLYRTKRWQRRWFVLYDDGELSYSVDDLPATIPQGVVDMNRVLEVSNAEDITGNKYSLALTAPDRVTFVKGTSPEESRWWQDVLSIFPRMHKHGRHKRNATFPGIKGSSGAGSSAVAGLQHARVGANTRGPSTLESPVNQRVRFNSISSDLRGARRPSSAPSLDSTERHLFSSGRFSSPAVTTSSRHYDSVNESSNGSDVSNEEEDEERRPAGSSSLPTAAAAADIANQNVGDVVEDDSTRNTNDKNSFYDNNNSGNNNRNTASCAESYSSSYGGAYYSGSNNNLSSSSGVTPYNSLQYSRSVPIPTPTPPSTSPASHSTPLPSNPSRMMRDEHKENTPPYMPEYHDNPPTSESPPTQDKHTHRLRTRRALNREARALSQPRSEQLQPCSVLADLEASKREEKLKDIAASITTTSSRRRHHHLHHHASQGSAVDKPTRDRDPEVVGDTNVPTDTPPPAQLRGAPDGCGGADDSGSGSLQRVDLPAEDLLYIKKGWLLKAGDKQEWNKYWFVLHGGGLRFYRNSGAEDTGIMDGIIDLGTAKDIHNKEVARNHGFVIKTWSGQQYVFSAVTAGIRTNWVQALRNAANLKPATPPDPDKEGLNKSAIIESLAAEKDQTVINKSLLAYNNKNTSLSNSMNNIINNKSYTGDATDKTTSLAESGGVSKSNISVNATDDTSGRGHLNGLSGDNSQLQCTSSPQVSRTHHHQSGPRVSALSSDEEYKTASETSATSNLSHDNADFFDWESRSRTSSGRTNCNERRSHSSPPNSRRGTVDSFPHMETLYGLNSGILDRYKNMQNHTRSQAAQSPASRPSPTPTAALDEVDHPRGGSTAPQHLHCDALSTCARLGNLGKDDNGYRLSDSMRSLDLDASLQHDTVSSSGTLASGSGDALLVDLLETQVETLKAKLEATQADLMSLHKEHLALHQRLSHPPPPSSTSSHHLHHHPHQSALHQHGDTTSSQETLTSRNELEDTKLLLADTRGYLANTRDCLAETRVQLETVQKQNMQYQTELKDSKNELLRYQTELDESKVEASLFVGQLEQSQSEVLQYKTQLEESRNVVLKFQAQLELSAKEVYQYQNQLEESQDLIQQLQQQLEESQNFVHQLQQQLEQIQNELEKTQHHLQETCENHVAFRAQMEEQISQGQALRSQNLEAGVEEASSEEHLKAFTEDGSGHLKEQESLQLMEQMNQMNVLVSSLQDEVDRLTDQLSLKERQLTEENSSTQALRLKHEREKSAWRGRAESHELQLQQLADTRQDTILQLRSSLEASEHRVAVLAAQLEGRNSRTVKEGQTATNNTLDALQRENSALARQLSECQAEAAQLKDNLKCEKSEVYKWKDLVKELRSLLDGRNQDMDRKREELRVARESLRSQQQEHAVTRDRLQRGIEENEALSSRLRELQRQLHSQDKRTSSTPSVYSSREKFSSRRHLPRLDSLSDLSNVDFSIDPELLDKEALTDAYCDVRSRLERAISEIRALKRELRESQDAHDALQLTHLQQGQNQTRQKQDAVGQLQLMTDRVQDLTNKLSNSEKQVRLLKTKVTRAAAESRDRRRTHSLKGKDAFGLGKDVDQKLSQLEAKIAQLMPTIDTGLADGSSAFVGFEDSSKTLSEELRASATSTPTSSGSRPHLKHTKRSKSFDDPSKATRLRRKSLESSNGGDGGVKAALRINNLEAKVAALTPARSRSPSRTGSPAESPLRSPMRSPSMSRRTKSRSSGAERGSRARRTDLDGRTSVADLPATDTLGLVCSQLCECVEWLETFRCSCGHADLSTLQQRLACAHQLAAGGAQLGHVATSPVSERVKPVAQQMVLLLQQKIAALAERRDTLKATSSWTKEAQMKNFAERIAYETVLLSQVSQALKIANQSNCNLDSIKLQDLMESHRKMAFLEKKLTHPEFDLDSMAPLEFYTSMLAEKLVVTGEVLSCVNSDNDRNHSSTLDATCRDLQGRLLERERQLARLVTSYKEEKLHEVAVVMAQELSSAVPVDDTVLMEEIRIREAWTTAHQLLVQQIVDHQSSQSLLRLAHLLNPPNDCKPVASLSLTLCSAEAVDRLQTAAEESLRQEMEESVLTLSQKYEEVLAQYRAGDTSLVNSVSASMDEVLTEFAGVMAQKALIDGHLALLQDEYEKGSFQTTQDSLIIFEDNKDPMESAGDVLDSEAHLLMFLGGRDSSVESLVKPALSHSEFTFIFNRAYNSCSTESTNLLMQLLSQKAEASELVPLGSSSSYRSSTRSLQHASPAVSDRDQDSLDQPQLRSATSLSKILPSPKARRKSETRKSRRLSDITGMTSLGCRQCEELRHELHKLKKKLQIQNTVAENKECDTCPKLLDTIERLEIAQLANVSRVESGDGDSDDELSKMKERIMVVEASYEAQISVLQQKYEEALAANPDSCDETAREKYQKEIEQLRVLCEMGLGTMESSQQRIVAEIKEKHRRELTLLQAEKEQALAEETQATLAALDAMRKAHEAEVQREVAKIKEEFIRKMQGGEDIGEITQQHEAEMHDIRREILSLSEKYSVKCLEAANQETRIENLNKQLVEATKAITELEARNVKLKAQLTEKIEAFKSGVRAGDTESELRARVAEAVVKEDRLVKMGSQLQKAQAHEAEVLEVCRHLRHYLRSDRPLLPTDQLAAVTDRLEHLMLTGPTALRDGSEGPQQQQQQQRQARPHLRRPKVLSSKELTRSPSCPRLGAQPPRLSCHPVGDDPMLPSLLLLNSPLSGMVASRKKVFEAGDCQTSPTSAAKLIL